MSLINDIKNISFLYIKQHYDKYRKKKNKQKLNNGEIIKFSNKIYEQKKYRMINYIRTHINKKYEINKVNELIDEYIDDQDFVVKRLKTEIEIYQNSNN